MPQTYEITAPNGQTYSITGPAGATREQVIAEVLRQNPAAGDPPPPITPVEEQPQEPSAVGQVVRDVVRETGETLGNVGLGAAGLVGIFTDPVQAVLAKATGNEPQGLVSYLEGQAPSLVGDTRQERLRNAIARGVGGGGAVLGAARAAQGVGGAAGLVASEIARYPLAETFGSIGAEVAGQAAEDAGLPWYGQIGASLAGGLAGGIPGAIRDIPNIQRTTQEIARGYQPPRLGDEDRLAYEGLLREGSVDDIMEFFSSRPQFMVSRDEIANYVSARDQGAPVQVGERYVDPGPVATPGATSLADEATTFLRQQSEETPVSPLAPEGTPSTVAAEAVTSPSPTGRVKELQDEVEGLSRGWANRPSTLVVDSPSSLPDGPIKEQILREAPTAKGVTTEEGEIVIFADNIKDSADLSSVFFHEALGHAGMANQFKEGLDSLLQSFLLNSPDFRMMLDDWRLRNPNSPYKGRADQELREAEEVLARMSEEGRITKTLMDQIKNFIKTTARRMGMKNVDYSEREIRSILADAHTAMIEGRPSASLPRIGRTSGLRFSTEEEVAPGIPKVSFEDLPVIRNMDDLKRLEDLYDSQVPINTTTDEEMLARVAETRWERPSEIIRGKNLSDREFAKRIYAANATNEKLYHGLLNKAIEIGQSNTVTPEDMVSLRQLMDTSSLVNARVTGDNSELGRAFRAIQVARRSAHDIEALHALLNQQGGADALADPENMRYFLQQLLARHLTQGPTAAQQYMNNVRKTRFEDYASSVLYNAMLSHPKTWLVNFAGTGSNILNELAVSGSSALVGQAFRVLNLATKGGYPRYSGSEFLGRMSGFFGSFADWRLYKNTLDALRTGVDQVGTQNKLQNVGPVFKGPSTIIETPGRIMAASDEFWRNIAQSSNMKGLAVRQAHEKGLRGKALWKEVSDTLSNPPKELLAQAIKDTQRMLFRDRDDSTIVTKWLQDLQKPRYEDVLEVNMIKDPLSGKLQPKGKTVKKADSAGTRAARFALRTQIPFLPTLDSIARTVMRNTPVAQFFSKSLREDLMAGGIRRQSALGRITWATTAVSYLAYQVASGNIEVTGSPQNTPSRRGENQTLEAVRPPNAIRIGDSWQSYQGFEPIAATLSMVGSAVDRLQQDGEINQELVHALISAVASSISEVTYAEGLFNTLEILAEGSSSLVDGAPIGSTTTNALAGLSSVVINPGFARFINDTFFEDYRQDTTGDTSFGGRISGRIKSAPISQLLGADRQPTRYDVYGRPVKSGRGSRPVETNPAILEMDRLERKVRGEVLVGPPGRHNIMMADGERKTLNSQEYQEYQKLAGTWLVKAIEYDVAQPGWSSVPDEEKIAYIKKVRDQARQAAREELFSGGSN